MLRTLLVFGILIPGISVALFNRFAGLLLYLWFALFRPQDWMWMDTSALRLSLVLGVLLVVPSFLTGAFPTLSHSLSVGGLAFLLTCVLGQVDAVRPDVGWQWLDFLFRLLLVCSLAITITSNQKRFRLTLAVVAGSLGFHAAKAGLASVLGGGVRFFDGLAGAFGDNNGYAVAMVMVAPLLLAAGQTLENTWIRRGFLAATPLTAFAVVSTYSRGAFLAMVACALTMAALHRRRTASLAAIVVLALPLGFFVASQEGYVDRLETVRTYEETNEDSALGRLHFWRVAVEMVREHPLGVGLFNYEAAYDDFDFSGGRYGHNRSVHSSHFQVLAEAGILGLVAWVATFVCAFRCAFRIRRRGQRQDLSAEDQQLFLSSANGLIASMVGFLVGGSFVAMALNDLTWITFALVASLDRVSARSCEAADAVSQEDTGEPVQSTDEEQRSLAALRPLAQPAP